MFNVGDKIVYPMHGAGTIDSIEEKDILGEKQSYYILKMPSNVKVMIPTAKAEEVTIPSFKKGMAPTLIKTGIKAYMQDGEVLMLYNRSSNPKKKGLILSNSVGVIDKDYYENPDNDGHIMFAFYNIKEEDITIKKGEVVGQAVFQKYFVTDNDIAEGERLGGFGSTSK